MDMKRITGTVIGFFCLGLSMLACPRGGSNPPPVAPLPPVVDGSACLSAVAITSKDVCKDKFTPNEHACFRCPGASGCTVKGIEVYCVVADAGCADSLCAFRTAPPSQR